MVWFFMCTDYDCFTSLQSGPNSSLRIDIDDPEAQAIEFLIFDEAQDKWLVC